MDDQRKPISRAAALRYERGENAAPQLVAKGQGVLADQILEAARSHGIPIHQDRTAAAIDRLKHR